MKQYPAVPRAEEAEQRCFDAALCTQGYKEVVMLTVLVPLDGSELAEQILPSVRALATLISARICLVQVVAEAQRGDFLVRTPPLFRRNGHGHTSEAEAGRQVFLGQQHEAVCYLEVVARPLREAGFDVTTDVHFGSPATCIVETARHRGATLIAMATHGYGGWRRWAVGSVTDRVIRTTTTPVLVVRGREESAAQPLMLKRILVPLDGSQFGKQALPIAIELARQAHASIHLVHALLPGDELPAIVWVNMSEMRLQQTIDERQREIEQHLAVAMREIQAAGIPVSSRVMIGQPAEMIVAAANQRQSDLIVMATHGYGGFVRFALGSVADRVLHTTTTPLLLVHAESREARSKNLELRSKNPELRTENREPGTENLELKTWN